MTVFYVFRFWPFSEVAPPLKSEMHRLPDIFCQVAAKQGETVLLVGSSEQLASETRRIVTRSRQLVYANLICSDLIARD